MFELTERVTTLLKRVEVQEYASFYQKWSNAQEPSIIKITGSCAIFFILYVFITLPEISDNMTTIIINEKTKKGRIILDLIREMGAGKIIDDSTTSDPILNKTTIKAIQEAKKGNTIKCNDFEDYLNKVK